jgi:hypothetical protein
LLPLSLLLLWLYPRLEGSRRNWLWLTPLFAVALWAKMTNPLTFVAVIAAWQVLSGRILRGLLHSVTIGGCGAVVAGVAWLAIGTWLHFPLDMPFGVNAVEAQDSADVARRAYVSAGAFIDGLQPTVIWLGPGLVALGIVGAGVRVAALARRWRLQRVDLLIGVGILLVLLYVNKSAGWFPKYQVALAVLLACIAAPLLAHLWHSRLRLSGAVVVGSSAAALVVMLLLVRDEWGLQRTWAIAPAAALALLGIVVVAALVGAAVRAPATTAVVAILGVAAGWSVGVDLVQVHATYQTDYWYGTTGTLEAANWVSEHLAPNQTYAASKEVAIRTQALRYVDQDNLVYVLNTGHPLESTWMGEPLHALVLWQRDPYIADLLDRSIPGSSFREVARFGDYVVYLPLSS